MLYWDRVKIEENTVNFRLETYELNLSRYKPPGYKPPPPPRSFYLNEFDFLRSFEA